MSIDPRVDKLMDDALSAPQDVRGYVAHTSVFDVLIAAFPPPEPPTYIPIGERPRGKIKATDDDIRLVGRPIRFEDHPIPRDGEMLLEINER